MKWDVYIWPIDNADAVTLVAKDVDSDTAQEVSNRYFQTDIYDTYLVPTGSKLITI